MSHRPACLWTAIAFAIGITIGRHSDSAIIWSWLAGTIVSSLAAAILIMFRWRIASHAVALAAVICLGAGWYMIKIERVPDNHLSNFVSNDSALVHLHGYVASEPTIRSGTTGNMARFDYRPPATFFRLRVIGLRDNDDVLHTVTGHVLLRSVDTLPPLHPGDLIEVQGKLVKFQGPRNPGGFDRETYAKILDQVGLVMVPNRQLVTLIEKHHTAAWVETVTRWRTDLRRTAGNWIVDDLPPDSTQQRDALLAAILLGERQPELHEVGESFRRVGLSHLLAISGMHLGILAGMVLLIFRIGGKQRRWHCIALIIIILLYLFLIEARMPVIRAAIMICAAATGMLFQRHIYVGGLVALSAIGLLTWQPAQLFDAGFQLSFGVVLGLIAIVPRLYQRWFEDTEEIRTPNSGGMVLQRLQMIFVVSIVAWAIALPIVAYHFQMISPLAALASVVALPIASVILAFGYAKLLASALLPSIGFIFGVPLAIFCDLLLAIVNGINAAPFATLEVPQPTVAWAVVAIGVSISWLIVARPYKKKSLIIATLSVGLWLWWPTLSLVNRSPNLRIDMLAVGDGSCYVIRSGRATVLFDAGSGNDLDVGRSTIVPALKAMHITSLDAIIISHANLDHYAGILEVSDRFDVDRIIITAHVLQRAAEQPLGPMAYVLEQLTERIVLIEEVAAGTTLRFGKSSWTWLHPTNDADFSHVNDESMVVKIAPDHSPTTVLLTGDIQDDAIELLLNDDTIARELHDADIVELPHHGSFRDGAIELMEQIQPRVVLQSTGQSRLNPDRWADILADTTRLITARDGAATVIVHEDGTIETRRFLEE